MVSLRFFTDHKHPFHRVVIGLFAWVIGGSFAIWGIQFALADESTPFFNERPGGEPGARAERRIYHPEAQPSQETEMPRPSDDRPMDEGSRDHQRGDLRGPGMRYEEQEKEREEQRQVQMARQFTQMKSGLKRLAPMFKRISTRIIGMEKSGITVPVELKENLATMQKDLEVVLGAESLEDEGVQEALDDMQSKQQDMQEGMQTLERLARFPGVIKRVQSEVKRLESSLARAKRAKSKIDITSSVQDFEQAVSSTKVYVEKAKTAIANGEADEAIQLLEGEVFDSVQEARQLEQAIQMLQNVSANLGKMNSFITQSKTRLLRMQKKGENVADSLVEVGEMSTKLDELKKLLAQKPISPEEINDVVQDLWSKRQDIEEVLGQSNQMMDFSHDSAGEVKDFQDFEKESASIFAF